MTPLEQAIADGDYRTIQITPAPPGWFYIWGDDGESESGCDPVGAWALIELQHESEDHDGRVVVGLISVAGVTLEPPMITGHYEWLPNRG